MIEKEVLCIAVFKDPIGPINLQFVNWEPKKEEVDRKGEIMKKIQSNIDSSLGKNAPKDIALMIGGIIDPLLSADMAAGRYGGGGTHLSQGYAAMHSITLTAHEYESNPIIVGTKIKIMIDPTVLPQ